MLFRKYVLVCALFSINSFAQNINFLETHTQDIISVVSCEQLQDTSFLVSVLRVSTFPQNTFSSSIYKLDDCGDSLNSVELTPLLAATHDITVKDICDLKNGTFAAMVIEYQGSTLYGIFILKYTYNLQPVSSFPIVNPGTSPNPLKLHRASANEFFITGVNNTGTPYGYQSAFALKCDSSGNIAWFKQYDTPVFGGAYFTASRVAQNNDLFINFYKGQVDTNYTVRVSNGGSTLWQKATAKLPEDMELDYNGNLIVTLNDSAGNLKMFRLSQSTGNIASTHYFTNAGLLYKRLARLNDNRIVQVSTAPGPINGTGHILLLDTALNVMYEADSLSVTDHRFASVKSTFGGGYFACGPFYPNGSITNIIALKAEDNGCDPLIAKEVSKTPEVVVFPVPADDKIIIHFNEAPEMISIYDVLMRNGIKADIQPDSSKHEVAININSLKVGIYFVVLRYKEISVVRKIVRR